LPLALVAGLTTSLNPCSYAMIGTAAGYLSAHGRESWRRRSILAAGFLAGLVAVYAALGAAGSLMGQVCGISRRGWTGLLAAVCLVAGLLVADLVHCELPTTSLLPRLWSRLAGLPGAVLLGVLMGLVATPCATPPLVAIVAVASAPHAAGYAALLLSAYAVGHALPAVLLGLLAGGLSSLDRLAPYGRALQVGSGWIMIAVGLYLIWAAL
jgi:cytochrome c-type biogenesis protein